MSGDMHMPAARLLELLDALEQSGVHIWLDGGWGVDALLGQQHREHGDADLVVGLTDVDRLVDVLAACGFAVADNLLPTRLVLRTADGEQVDVHPVTFDAAGDARQAQAAPDGGDCLYPADQFTSGSIDGRSVPCIGPLVQVDHHSGYEPRPHDIADMRRLARRFGLELPPPTDRRTTRSWDPPLRVAGFLRAPYSDPTHSHST